MRIKIRETDQKVETTSKRLSDHLTLNMKVEIYIPAKPDKLIKKDLQRVCPDSKLRENFLCHWNEIEYKWNVGKTNDGNQNEYA